MIITILKLWYRLFQHIGRNIYYDYLDEDENIKDIYERIYDQAMATEEFDEAGNPLTDYEVCNFEYPEEIVALIKKYKKMKTIYPEA